jgi:DNA-binding XRE family transcriptional regulator
MFLIFVLQIQYMATLTNAQKQDWAKVLYLKENLTQKEIAQKVGSTEKTISAWVNKGNWERLRSSLIVTKEEELRRIYMQINELNTAIFARPEGARFANNKEADTLAKLAATIRALETETSIADTIEVAKNVINFIKKEDLPAAQNIAKYFDEFIKNKLA